MSFVSPVAGKLFGENRQAYIYAVSRRESSSDLTLSDMMDPNQIAKKVHNSKTIGYGFIGYFQFGESALYDLGYFKPSYSFSNDSKSLFQKSFSVNDWKGSWTGLDDVTSKSIFLKDRTIQIKAFNNWINILCGRLNSQNVNEFYGVRVNGIEITESGCIAGAHLKGPKYVLEFVQGVGNKADAFGTKVGEYISLFAHYDLESCCNRKVYINVVDELGNPVSEKKIIVESEYKEGDYYSKIGKISNNYKTNKEGKIPVIVRHPGSKIKIIVDGKSLDIIQQKNKKESYTIKLTKEVSVPAVLGQINTPQPKPQSTKTPQEVRNEQSNSNVDQKNNSDIQKDVSFNIKIVEGDTGKPISNMGFYLTYKGNIKKHSADSNGVKENIKAEVGQDIEVSVSGDGKNQKIHHFKVEESLNNQMVTIKLQVHNFQLILKKDDQIVPNTLVSIFYRGRQISKRTNIAGVLNLKMLVGFVYGFGVGDKILAKARVINGSPYRIFRINEGFVKESMSIDTRQIKLKQKPIETKASTSNKVEQKTTEVQLETPKVSQQNTHTENGGKPLTKISNQTPATSDTTRYHIYSDGKIKRENKAATGYAEFIYYDVHGNIHNLGKSKIIKAPKRAAGNAIIKGNCYLIDFTKHGSYKNGDVGYKFFITGGNIRYYLSGITLAGMLGTFMSLGYEEYPSSGGSLVDGSSQAPSKTHRNGEACDLRYLGINNSHRKQSVWTQNENYDSDRNIKLVNQFKKFGFKAFYTQDGNSRKSKILGTSFAPGHYHHLHIGTCMPSLEDI